MANNDNFSILFIDDEEQARRYFKRAYSKYFDILTAENVEQAKIMLDQHSDEIGVLITDQRMPGGNGVVLLSYAKAKYPHIVRLLTTAYSDLEDAIEAVNSGEILRYIVKPWDIKSLHIELKQALNYFTMRRERDQLVREKMNVWQRMTEINRVRDLLVMAGSFSHLNHSLQGIRSLLLQTLVKVELFSEEQSLEMWGLLEEEVHHILALAESVISATRVTDGRFLETSIPDLLLAIAEKENHSANFQITSSRDWPEPKGCPELLSRLFESLARYFATVIGDPEPNLMITREESNHSLVLNVKPVLEDLMQPFLFSINKELLIVFFIAAHHGGEVLLNKEHPISLDLRLPLADDKIFTVGNEDYWLDKIFSLYET